MKGKKRSKSWSVLTGIGVVVILLLVFLSACAKPSPTPSPSPTAAPSPSPSPTPPAKPIELKLAHFMSPKHVQHTQVMVPWAEEVEKVTQGRVKITIYPGGALGKPPDQYDNCVTGVTDIAFGLHGYTLGKFPLCSVMELPFMVTSAQAGSHAFWDLYHEFPEIQAEHQGVKVLWLWTHDVGQILTVKKPVRTLEDLRGLKLRCPSASQKPVIEALGATPVMMPISELYDSLQKGVVDGTVIPMSAIYDFNLQDVAKYVTLVDAYVCTFFMVMNLNSWNKISPQDQKAIESLIGKSMMEKAAKAYDEGAKLGFDVCKKAGLEIYTLPSEELARWKEAVKPVKEKWLASMKDKGLPGQEVYEEAVKLCQKYNQQFK